MCGLVGVLFFSGRHKSVDLSSSIRSINHRGPDGHGVFEDEFVSIGHTRLSVIDLSEQATQPMLSADGRFVIVFNGEVYNFLELRSDLISCGRKFTTNSDTEVLLQLIEEFGFDGLNRVRGMYALALWDRESRSLTLARDPFGEKPLYVWHDDDMFLFSSEMKTLLRLIPQRPPIDLGSVHQFLHYQYVPEPRTMLVGVTKLPKGTIRSISSSSKINFSKSIWNFHSENGQGNDNPESYQSAIEGLRHEFAESVRISTRSDVPLGVSLSGGLDSGAIATFASRFKSERLTAISIGYPGRPFFDERRFAGDLGRKLGLEVLEVEVSTSDFQIEFTKLIQALDDPIADPSAFAQWQIYRAARDFGLKVMLTGLGADELFWGYEWVQKSVCESQSSDGLLRLLSSRLRLALRNNGFWTLPQLVLSSRHQFGAALRSVKRKALQGPSEQLLLYELEPNFRAAFSEKIEFCGDSILERHSDELFDPTAGLASQECGKPERVIEAIFDTWLASNCLSLADRLSMSVGVEVRNPFIDRRFVERSLLVKKNWPDHERDSKRLLKDALRGHIDESLITRYKQGFRPPVQEWLRAVVETHLESVCCGDLRDMGVVSANCDIKRIKSRLSDFDTLFFWYKLTVIHFWIDEVWKKSSENQ